MPESFLKSNHAELFYGNKMAIFSSQKELITVIIESPDIVAAEVKLFETIWVMSPLKST